MQAIGQVAQGAGVSCRTLRYYEELGLLTPSGHTSGGARRYTEEDVARLNHIREMQNLMGLGLDEIGSMLWAEDRLGELRSEYRSGTDRERQREILAEAAQINDRLRSQVRAKMVELTRVLGELEAKADRYRTLTDELFSPTP
ncbi:MAG: MerR family transcriptional regulator [Acidimicrobiales bacterium]